MFPVRWLCIISPTDGICGKPRWGPSLRARMAWCRQATNHYLNQCWSRSRSPYGINRPQWSKQTKSLSIPFPSFILTNSFIVFNFLIWLLRFAKTPKRAFPTPGCFSFIQKSYFSNLAHRLISTMGFPILVRWYLYIESAPRLLGYVILLRDFIIWFSV